MKAVGIEKARRRLKQAQACLSKLKRYESDLSDKAAFEDSWSEFLSALNSVPEILRTSSKGYPESRQWINSIHKNVLRKDPLLKFLIQARGADYHGLQLRVNLGAKMTGKFSKPSIELISFTMKDSEGNQSVTKFSKDQLFEEAIMYYKFSEVEDHRGNVFAVPKTHLGKALPEMGVIAAAKAAYNFYSNLLDEATRRTV